MGAREHWKEVEVTIVVGSENDGAVFMRKGAERIEERLTVAEAVHRYGTGKVAEMIRAYADKLEKKQ
jgi:predicted mannosyl-3-phosphoglycerate phosphatase (HAD superfamily)